MSARRKIMLIGDIGVGKTSMIRRLVLGKFEGTYRGTLSFDLYTFEVSGAGPKGDQDVPLVIWDSDGDLGADVFRHPNMQGTSGALILGDVTRPETFASMAVLARGFRANFPGRHATLVLNKTDLVEGEVPVPNDLVPLVDMGVPLIRASALSGENVIVAFRDAATAILRRDV
jgi:GTPase SAR1 family protein